MRSLRNYVDGRWLDSAAPLRRSSFNPANREELLAESPESSVAEVEAALAAAQAAGPAWTRLPMPQRAAVLERWLELLKSREEDFVAVITRENGKTRRESRAEYLAAVKEAAYQIGRGRQGGGRACPAEMSGVHAELRREPLGVVALVTPWNFPLNVACRKMIPALIAGNTCVLKPSELTPITAALLFETIEAAKLPPGVANLVFGPGSAIGDALTGSPVVQAVSFTGSTAVGLEIARKLAGRPTKLQLELGGKNPLVVLADADLDRAVEAAVTGAFSCSGQWCTSTSRVIVESEIHDRFVQRLAARAREIVVGNGADEASMMGPVCGQRQYENVLRYIAIGRSEGAKLAAGGAALTSGAHAQGYFIAPTVFSGVKPEMKLAQEEIFGPVVAVFSADTLDEAIALANRTPYGLASSIYTSSLASAQRFVAGSDVGLCHVNLHTAYKEPQLEFGGVKQSGRGDPEAGESGLEFFTRHKAVYLKAQP